MAKKTRRKPPVSPPPKRASVGIVVVISFAFLLSVIVIVSLELAAGWNLDKTEKSFVVLVCLMGSFAARWLWGRFGKGRT